MSPVDLSAPAGDGPSPPRVPGAALVPQLVAVALADALDPHDRQRQLVMASLLVCPPKAGPAGATRDRRVA